MIDFLFTDYGLKVFTMVFFGVMLAFGGFVAGFILGDRERKEDRVFNQRRDEYHSEL